MVSADGSVFDRQITIRAFACSLVIRFLMSVTLTIAMVEPVHGFGG
jgi:hypothetical protein